MGSAASLENENENSRITGAAGGQVLFTTSLNAPVAVNPASLGIIISSALNLGTTIIRRGHEVQLINSEESILRYYDIVPSVNTALNATLRFHYFDAELNGNAEDDLVHWQTDDNITWTNEGKTAYPNPVLKWVNVELLSARNEAVVLGLVDNKGRMIKEVKKSLIPGINQLRIDFSVLPKGIYWLQIQWKDGKEKKMSVLKM